jgi:hypothetical protein
VFAANVISRFSSHHGCKAGDSQSQGNERAVLQTRRGVGDKDDPRGALANLAPVMIDIPRGKYLRMRNGPLPTHDAELFVKCPACDGWIDCSSTRATCRTLRRITAMTGAEFRNSDRRHSANLPGPQGLREEATRLLRNPYSVIEVKTCEVETVRRCLSGRRERCIPQVAPDRSRLRHNCSNGSFEG